VVHSIANLSLLLFSYFYIIKMGDFCQRYHFSLKFGRDKKNILSYLGWQYIYPKAWQCFKKGDSVQNALVHPSKPHVSRVADKVWGHVGRLHCRRCHTLNPACFLRQASYSLTIQLTLTKILGTQRVHPNNPQYAPRSPHVQVNNSFPKQSLTKLPVPAVDPQAPRGSCVRGCPQMSIVGS
jgi:hypothetical protein